MNLTFSQSAGTIVKDDGTVVTSQAFAGNDSRPGVNPGHLQGRNNPRLQAVKCIGPLPQGVYRVGEWGTHSVVGQNSAPLTQIGGDSFGRGDFFIHGPGADYANSSEGCIVIPHDDRMRVIALNPTTITVVA